MVLVSRDLLVGLLLSVDFFLSGAGVLEAFLFDMGFLLLGRGGMLLSMVVDGVEFSRAADIYFDMTTYRVLNIEY